jgi:SAM-dependent methyltransferase
MSQCPCCENQEFHDLVTFNAVPVSIKILNAPNDPVIARDLSFEVCSRCALVRLRDFDRPPDYTNINRAPVLRQPPHVEEMVRKLVARGVRSSDFLLEIGSNDGSFLEVLHNAGFNNVVGVEPSRVLADVARAKGFRIENDYFDVSLAHHVLRRYGHPAAVVCRHTLEHVPDPDTFIAAIRQCLDQAHGWFLLEIPDGSAIPDLMNVYEFWYEHLFYFSAANVEQLLRRNRFDVLEIQSTPHLDTRNLVAWTKPVSQTLKLLPDAAFDSAREAWGRFGESWKEYKAAFSRRIVAAARPVYAIGASHSQTNFFNYADIISAVDFMIDDDPAKVGRFAPVREKSPAVISTKDFESSAHSGTVIKTGFGYRSWTARICDHAKAKGITIIDPYSEHGLR